MELSVIILIFLAGLVAIVIELFLPGVVLGLLGFLAVAGSIIYAAVGGYYVTAVVLTAATIALVPVFLVLWKSVLSKVMSLKADEVGFRPSTTIDESLVGLEGMALSPLRPSGIAELDGRRHHVVTRGEMLERGSRIKVIEVSGNRVVVTRM